MLTRVVEDDPIVGFAQTEVADRDRI